MLIINQLLWDEGNIAHVARHQVTPEEVEQTCSGVTAVRDTYEGRLLLLGRTTAGRILAVVLDPEQQIGTFYVVTARSANRKERLIYQQEIEKEAA